MVWGGGGPAGCKPIRDPLPGALREPPSPPETCQGNKTVLGGEEAEKGESWRGERPAKLKGLVRAQRWLRAVLR